MKPFALSFDYTPKWKNNRERPEADRVTVRLRDFPQSKQIALSEEYSEGFKAIDFSAMDDTAKAQAVQKSLLELKKNNLNMSFDLLRKQLISVSNLAVLDAEEKELEIKTADQLIEHCEELAMELVTRLVNGADADEIKN
jgi:lantibiotic modifying enzyme